MTIVIPTYRPDARLAELVAKLKAERDFPVVLADDGSGPAFGPLLESLKGMGCTVLFTPKHSGKGRALKTAFRFLLEHAEEDGGIVAVTGRRVPPASELLKIAEAAAGPGRNIVLGMAPHAGWRRRFFQTLCSGAPSMPGMIVLNAEADVRGYPRALLPSLLEADGDGAEYELNILLDAKRRGYGFTPLCSGSEPFTGAGFYRSGAVRSALLSGWFLLKFCFSGLLSAAVDYLLLFLLQLKTNNLLVSVVGARTVSSILNYGLNRAFVFESKNAKRQKALEMLRYYALVVVLLAVNYLLLRTFSQTLKINLVLSKLMAEALLFLFSFAVQRLFVFQGCRTENGK